MQSGNLPQIATFAETIFMEGQVRQLHIARNFDADENIAETSTIDTHAKSGALYESRATVGALIICITRKYWSCI